MLTKIVILFISAKDWELLIVILSVDCSRGMD